jgi:membrane protease YdiL (CAAX protease family)
MKLALLVPYVAMVIGLYIFKSGWIAFILYHLLILGFLIYSKKLSSWKNMFKGFNLGFAFGAILFGLMGGIILYFLSPYAGVESKLTPVLTSLGLTGGIWMAFVIYHFLINSWFEEFFWRDYLGSDKKGFVFSDFVFAGYHLLVLALFLSWPWWILSFAILSFAAWFWRHLRRKYNGLLMPILSHIAADASIMLVAYFISL